MKVLVIGGVAAGTKAAAKLKRLDRSADVRILTMSKDIILCRMRSALLCGRSDS